MGKGECSNLSPIIAYFLNTHLVFTYLFRIERKKTRQMDSQTDGQRFPTSWFILQLPTPATAEPGREPGTQSGTPTQMSGVRTQVLLTPVCAAAGAGIPSRAETQSQILCNRIPKGYISVTVPNTLL